MSEISAKDVKELRDRTGAGMMDAKKALEKAGGDIEQAIENLKKAGMLKAEKKASRETAQGLIDSYIHDGRVGVLLEVNCETDFVARNKEFQELVHDLTLHVASHKPEDVKEMLKQPFVKDPEIIVDELLKQKIAKLGENIQISRFIRYELGE